MTVKTRCEPATGPAPGAAAPGPWRRHWPAQRPRRPLAATLLLGMALLLGACGTLPDARPFADASHALHQAVAGSGAAVGSAFADAALLDRSQARQYEEQAARFEQLWAARLTASEAAATYADLVADLVAAGQDGAAAVDRVAESLGALAAAVRVPLVSPAAGAAGDVARFLADRIALVRASARLEGAVADAQPAIDRIAAHLEAESDRQLRPILLELFKNQRSAVEQRHDRADSIAPQFEKRRDALREAALADARQLPALQELERAHERVAAQLRERDAEVARLFAVHRQRAALLQALNDATRAWALAHRDLVAALRAKRRVDVDALQRQVAELRDLIRKVRQS